MKILQISSAPISYLGGTEKVVWEISKRMSKKNDVTILQTNLYEPTTASGISFKEGVKIITCKNNLFFGGYGYSKEFTKKLKDIWKDYDLIHIHGYGRFASDFSLKFLRNKKPTIFTAHGFFHSKQYSFFKKLHDNTLGKSIKYAKYCTALTKLDFKEYLHREVKKERIIEIPNGVDLKKFFKVTKKEVEQFKSKFGLKKDFILYVGRIHQSKGLQYVIEAIKDLDTKFIIVGKDAGYKKELKEKIENLRISKKVIFTGNLNEKELLSAYKASKTFVLFSEWEGFGLVVIEAMAAGTTVITSDRGALPFLIKDNQNGMISKYPNVKELESKIRDSLKKNTKIHQIEKNAKEFSKKFSWEKVAMDYVQLYNKAIKK